MKENIENFMILTFYDAITQVERELYDDDNDDSNNDANNDDDPLIALV